MGGEAPAVSAAMSAGTASLGTAIAAVSAAVSARAPSDAYARYVLGLLVVLYVLNVLDRQISPSSPSA